MLRFIISGQKNIFHRKNLPMRIPPATGNPILKTGMRRKRDIIAGLPKGENN